VRLTHGLLNATCFALMPLTTALPVSAVPGRYHLRSARRHQQYCRFHVLTVGPAGARGPAVKTCAPAFGHVQLV